MEQDSFDEQFNAPPPTPDDFMPKSKALQIKSFKQAAREEFNYIKGRLDGTIISLLTGWSKFNQVSMNGLEWGNIITIAGLSGSGKTAALNELETSLFELNPDQEFVVLSFNFEMLARRLIGRKISKKMKKTVKQLYSADIVDKDSNVTKDELEDIRQYLDKTKATAVYYVDMPGTVEEIDHTIDVFSQRPEIQGKGIIVSLDHSILVKGLDQENQLQTLYRLGALFNRKKKQIKSAYIILSQLNRSIEKIDRIQNADLHYPMKADIFGADALFQYSDIVLVPHRPEMLGIRGYGPDKLPTAGFVYFHYLKVRDGEPVVAQMINDLKHNRIYEVESVNKSKQDWGTSGF